ncbi:hypothetical protein FBU59_000352 [Linderina macrospora]|uniref:Uncharacterized protein n=1 Tax=Linderina macrospora TaxID=4868 RepID=A0ACC1JH37_9FUNG|nr:hypothetical protein FBU59_000352 [Linderina macrospora]
MSIVNINISRAQKLSLEHADKILESEFICLTKMREILGRLGGYWDLDSGSIMKITAGTLDEAIEGIHSMTCLFQGYDGDFEPGCETDQRMKEFIDRANAWVRVNRAV